MKYGLIYYHGTHNLGDDILAYAGKQFLPQVDYYIDREHLDVFIPDSREHVAVIANGWYLHYNYTFQPSPYLYPFFIGIHLSKDQILFNDYSYIDASLVKYLQNPQPPKSAEKLAAPLIEKCNEFIQNTISTPPENATLPKLSDYQELYIDRTQYMRYTINCLYQIRYHLSQQLAVHTADINKTVDLCNKVIAENEELKRRLKELS